MKKLFIKNRKGQKIAVLVEKPENPKGLAFVMHGLGGFKEQPHIQTFAEAFLENGYTTIRFDSTNTIGESEGKMEDITVTSSFEDLEDVINWAESQEWYEKPFVLAGHSLGGISIILYAEKYPERIKGLAPISTVISGKLTTATAYTPEYLDKWRRDGYVLEKSLSRPGAIKKINWHFIEDGQQYDVLPKADKLTMPTLFIVGENDIGTPLKHQQLLYDKLSGRKEIHVIKGAKHTFREKHELEEIKEIFDKWIKNL